MITRVVFRPVGKKKKKNIYIYIYIYRKSVFRFFPSRVLDMLKYIQAVVLILSGSSR